MRLRGDLHKIDLVIAQMGLENMQRLGLALTHDTHQSF